MTNNKSYTFNIVYNKKRTEKQCDLNSFKIRNLSTSNINAVSNVGKHRMNKANVNFDVSTL